MNSRRRLYPTVKEQREREEMKEKLGLANTPIAKGAYPVKTSQKTLNLERLFKRD